MRSVPLLVIISQIRDQHFLVAEAAETAVAHDLEENRNFDFIIKKYSVVKPAQE